MLFNSAHFLAFFPVVVCLYFALPHKSRWMLLLAASYYFYGSWRVEYLALLIGTTLVDYAVALWMDRTDDKTTRQRILILSLASNLGVLAFFKYANFFVHTTGGLFTNLPELQILLPVGISFYTFQSMSYTIDVYRRTIPAERHFGIFATYVAFFPQLVAGPIERPAELLPQFRQTHTFNWTRIQDGLKLMLWGFFKKVVIADRLSYYVNVVYSDVPNHDGLTILLATYCFAFQIFCDFSGYTDIARGAARVMGYELMLNFRQPYLAQSTQDFWARWHISLSSWFRDYVYIPLGGNRVSRLKLYRNLFITFVLSGLWHGANWTFVIWGAMHGLYLVLGAATHDVRQRVVHTIGLDRVPRALGALRAIITFHLVLLAWVLFRANTLADVVLVFERLATLPTLALTQLHLSSPFDSGRDLFFLLVILLAANFHHMRFREIKWIHHPLWATAALATQFWFIVVYGVFDNKQFIYFQF